MFDVLRAGERVATVRLPLMGAFNVRNALADVAVGAAVGLSAETVVASLSRFKGVRRRLEVRGIVDGITVFDDFAHHPTAVRETLEAVRAAQPGRRIWALFEPRSASSCRRVFQRDFAEAFTRADEVVIGAVYRSTLPEHERLSVTDLVEDLRRAGTSARYIAEVDEIVATVAADARPDDLVVVMSNGDFGGIHGRLLDALAAR
jgi:UDP-N-acetylmuramate: L-alanyl-gamma-D-glutamyl-meso-diaminopimelate ligase